MCLPICADLFESRGVIDLGGRIRYGQGNGSAMPESVRCSERCGTSYRVVLNIGDG